MVKPKEKKTVKEWCKTCRFNEITIKGKKYLQMRSGKIPTYLECLQCLYEAVIDMEITKPKNWRK